jgi:hypothetical protein
MMYFFKRTNEAKKIRERLSINGLPVDEEVFCSALSNGRAKSFERLNDTEFEDLKRLLSGIAREELLTGLYSIAVQMQIIAVSDELEVRDQKIIEYLKPSGIINPASWYKLKNPKGDLIQFTSPFNKLSFYALTLISQILGQVYLMKSSELN